MSVLHSLLNTFSRKVSKFYIFNSKYRRSKTSISDDNVYPRFALAAAENDLKFTNFRRSPEMISILEHVSEQQG